MATKDNANSQDIDVYSLAPDDNLDGTEIDKYKSYLDSAFKNQNIRNIAVTGSFGVGKSSVIHSFDNQREGNQRKFKRKKRKFLYISLMDCGTKKDDEKEYDRIEITILRQILSYCKRRTVPRLRFSVIPEELDFRFIAACLTFYVFLLLCTLLSDKLSYILHFYGYDFLGFGRMTLFGIALAETALFLFFGIYYALKYFKIKQINLQLDKDSIKAESSASSCEESILDEYRFDLIYVFEKLSKNYDAIVFEDMDRINYEICISVFQQLREINFSLNRRNNVKCFPFRFVYVVNDELMEEMEQTKFFDYIMSVVPSLGAENAKEKFQRIVMNKHKIYFDDLEETEMRCIFDAIDASQRLKDYRTLKHIGNEYSLYYSIADKSGISIEKHKGILLGFVIYKVLWPQDYHLIRSGKSFVFPHWEEPTAYKWSERHGNNDPHKEYRTIEALKDILTNKICLKLMGYSDTERKEYYENILKQKNLNEKKNLLEIDDEFICGKILFDEKANDIDIKECIKEIEDDIILYLIRYYKYYAKEASEEQQNGASEEPANTIRYSFHEFVKKLKEVDKSKADNFKVSEKFIDQITQALHDAGDSADIYAFAVLCFLNRGYSKCDGDNANVYQWLYTEKMTILEQRIAAMYKIEMIRNNFENIKVGFSREEKRNIEILEREIRKN